MKKDSGTKNKLERLVREKVFDDNDYVDTILFLLDSADERLKMIKFIKTGEGVSRDNVLLIAMKRFDKKKRVQ